MNILRMAFEGSWRVLFAGLVFGAGLPLVFALGVRCWAFGVGQLDGRAARPAAKVLAGLLFAVVVGGVVLGIALVVATGFGRAISFDSLIPTVVDKK
jgi:hypothetical protein